MASSSLSLMGGMLLLLFFFNFPLQETSGVVGADIYQVLANSFKTAVGENAKMIFCLFYSSGIFCKTASLFFLAAFFDTCR